MNGKILHFDPNSREGIISGDDGNRYRFIGPDWQESSVPVSGQTVDFIVDRVWLGTCTASHFHLVSTRIPRSPLPRSRR